MGDKNYAAAREVSADGHYVNIEQLDLSATRGDLRLQERAVQAEGHALNRRCCVTVSASAREFSRLVDLARIGRAGCFHHLTD